MILNHLGDCCNQIRIYSDGLALEAKESFLGDYERSEMDTDIYQNKMDSSLSLFKASNGLWMVCSISQCSIMNSLVLIIFLIFYNKNNVCFNM